MGWNTRYGLSAQDVTPFLDIIENFFTTEAELIILDVGSRHGLEAIKFAERFPKARIYCFEANPHALPELIENVAPHSQISVVPVAVNSFDGECDFFAINPHETITPWNDGNLGASSLYLARNDAKKKGGGERYVQDLIRVPCTRLDTFLASKGITKVDAIWMDLQGAELLALKSLPREIFPTLAVVQTELESEELYIGQSLMSETIEFLAGQGMVLSTSIPHGEIAGDYLFVNSGLPRLNLA